MSKHILLRDFVKGNYLSPMKGVRCYNCMSELEVVNFIPDNPTDTIIAKCTKCPVKVEILIDHTYPFIRFTNYPDEGSKMYTEEKVSELPEK